MIVLTACIGWVGPLADEVLLQSVRDALNTGPQANATWLMLGGTVVFVAILALLARYTSTENRRKPRPQLNLLLRAAGVLGLSERERHCIRQIARHAKLHSPVSLLLSPANLAVGVEQALRVRPDPELRSRADSLCRRLFGVPLPVPQRACKP